VAAARIAILLAGAVLSRRTAAADPACALAARVTGDPELRAAVVDLLSARGVPVTATGRCGRLDAVVTRDGERVRVAIQLDDGRSVERVADDSAAAATMIESWSRSDVAAPLLAPRRQELAVEPAPETVRTPVAFTGWRAVIGAAATATASDDGGLWAGGRIDACVRVGPVCAGAVVGYARDPGWRGDSERFATTREAIDLMAGITAPLELGRVTLWAGGAAGQTSVRVRTDLDHENLLGLALAGRLAAAYRIAGAWAVRADLGLDYTAFATTRILDDEGTDPPIAGAPRWRTWLGIGLFHGGR